MPRRLAVLTTVAGVGLAVIVGSAGLVAAQPDDDPPSTEMIDMTPNDPDMDMDLDMDMDEQMAGDGHSGRMHHEMMVAMHEMMMDAVDSHLDRCHGEQRGHNGAATTSQPQE